MNISQTNIFRLALSLAVFTLILGTIGYTMNGYTMDDAIYRSLALFVISDDSVPQNNIYVNIARFFAPIAVFLGGAQAVHYFSKYGFTKIILGRIKNHTIICGMGSTAEIISKKLCKQDSLARFIIVDSQPERKHIRNSYYVNRDIMNINIDKELKLKKAKSIYILTGSDYVNLDVLHRVLSSPNSNIKIHIKIESEIIKEIVKELKNENIRIINAYDAISDEFSGITNSDIIIAGIGSIGKRLALKLNSQNNITIIEQSRNAIDTFLNNNKLHQSDVLQCYCANVSSINNDDLLSMYNGVDKKDKIIFVCLGGDWLSYTVALTWKWWFPDYEINVIGNNIDKENFIAVSTKLHIYNVIEDGV